MVRLTVKSGVPFATILESHLCSVLGAEWAYV